MPTCYVPNCKSGYKKKKKDGEKPEKISLFKPNPSTEEMYQKWRQAIPRSDRIFGFKDLVCGKHFTPAEILWYYETSINGEVIKTPRGKAKLVDGAIPSIFPNCPPYLSKRIKRRKAPKERNKTVETNDVPLPPLCEISLPDEILPTEEDFCISSIDDSEIPSGWISHDIEEGKLFFKLSNNTFERHFILNKNDMKMKFYLHNKLVKIIQLQQLQCTSRSEFMEVFRTFSEIKACSSILNKNSLCQGFAHSAQTLCYSCRIAQRKSNACVPQNTNKSSKSKNNWRKVYNVRQKFERTKKKVNSLKCALKLRIRCAKTTLEQIQDMKLPPLQEEMIKHCIQASKVKSKHSMRYTTRWIYECVLMRIRCRCLYDSMRCKGIMPLPSQSTIYRYLKGLKATFGFHAEVFSMLKNKLCNFGSLERRGVIMFDEIKVIPNLSLNKTTFTVNGLTDLGEFTPKSQTNKPGDHGLVFMIQPFMGNWVQPIAAFLSKGAANGQVLTKLLIEAITLVENSGFKVDGVVCDAASWNRSMWKNFGINKNHTFCDHIMDADRKLFFFSDFPHLIKNVRNWVQKTSVFPTPDGMVKTAHWRQLLEYDEARNGKFGIKLCPKLTHHHLQPKHYAKMNVPMAYQFFGRDVAAAMCHLSTKNDSPFNGDEVRGSYSFIVRVNNLIRAMSSRCPKGALYHEECQEYKDILNFIEFLLLWKSDTAEKIQRVESIENICINDQNDDLLEYYDEYDPIEDVFDVCGDDKGDDEYENEDFELEDYEENKKNVKEKKKEAEEFAKEAAKCKKDVQKNISKEILTNNTFDGLIVTLKNVLELFKFLKNNFKMQYLMTSRVNQDKLEAFFGMIRSHGGNAMHPTSSMFIQIYRLLGAYALIRPPKGSNVVVDSDTTATLLRIKENIGEKENPEWIKKIDELVERGVDVFDCQLYQDSSEAIQYFAGYVARKSIKFTECKECHKTLTVPTPTQQNSDIITLRNFTNHASALMVPSKQLVCLVSTIENSLQGEIKEDLFKNFDKNIISNVVKELLKKGAVPLLGCTERPHVMYLTKKIISFLVVCRIHFICKEINKIIKKESQTKGLSKASKY